MLLARERRNARRLNLRRRSCSGLASPILVLAVWEFAVRSGLVNPALLPRPPRSLSALASIVASGEVSAPLGATLYLLFVAYFAASALGIGSAC